MRVTTVVRPPVGVSRSAKPAVAGSQVPTSVIPSPSQSPATGRLVEVPQATRWKDTAPARPTLRSVNVRVPADQTPRSVLPSPFQSPVTGRSPADPNVIVRVLHTGAEPAWTVNDVPLGSLQDLRAQLQAIAGIKRDEWHRYHEQVTDWEVREYLTRF